MNICVFGAASQAIDESYIELVTALGMRLAKDGHNLVFGAGGTGLMGAAVRGIQKGGGKAIGVIPEFFKEELIEAVHLECDEIIYTDSMRERKRIMEDMADAFIIVPGGMGTLEEFFEVLTLKQLCRHNKPIALYNINGYYDKLQELLMHCASEGFMRKAALELCYFSSDIDDVLEYIRTYNAKSDIRDLKSSLSGSFSKIQRGGELI